MYTINEVLDTIIQGNALDMLKNIPDKSIDCVITSPPYWKLRDYDVRDQIGKEKTLQEYLTNLLLITNELKRVMKNTGTLFWVHGDSYNDKKSLDMQNYRLAISMIDEQGWILRNTVVWHKTNAQPSSVKDRFNNLYEPVFFFVKSPHYYFDLDSVRTKWKDISINRLKYPIPKFGTGKNGSKFAKNMKDGQHIIFNGKDRIEVNDIHFKQNKYLNSNVKTASPGGRAVRTIMSGKLTAEVKRKLQDTGIYLKTKLKESGYTVKDIAELTGIPETTISHYFRTDLSGQAIPDRNTWQILQGLLDLDDYDNFVEEKVVSALPQLNPKGKNPGDILNIATEHFHGPHYAVYPTKLVEFFLKAGCPKGGIVLDPFMGAGTTGYVAKKMGIHYIGIELNPDYVRIANERIARVPDRLFW